MQDDLPQLICLSKAAFNRAWTEQVRGCGTLSAMSGSESNDSRPAEAKECYFTGQAKEISNRKNIEGFFGFAAFPKQRI